MPNKLQYKSETTKTRSELGTPVKKDHFNQHLTNQLHYQ